MFTNVTIMAVLLLGWCITAQAQVGVCPAGTIPNGTQTSAMECAPDPDYQVQQQPAPPPPVWADRWGATAAALPTSPRAFGAANDMPTRSAAEAAALAQCESKPQLHCHIDQIYHNQCYALTWGEEQAMGGIAPTLEEAKHLSLDGCKAHGNKQCIPYYSACSYPVRIR